MATDFLNDTKTLNLLSLPVAFLIALTYLMLKPRRRKTRFRTAIHVLLTKKTWLHPSVLMDFKYILIGKLFLSFLIAYVTLTMTGVGNVVLEQLNLTFGKHTAVEYNSILLNSFIIIILYLTYEFAYWLDHFLSHKIPFLWEFHKVHHSATILTPFTNWRMHPVDSIVFANILALCVGMAHGLIYYWFGAQVSNLAMVSINIIIILFMALYGHLQHSQFWIPFTGLTGKILISPAHHQIHHSNSKRHYDKNFGAGLAVFDWAFGTLYIPSNKKEILKFGVGNDKHLKGLASSILHPFYHSAQRFREMCSKKI